VHDIKQVNHEIRHGQYFFIDILRQGVKLFDSRRYMLASPKALEPADRLKLGLVSFRYWFASANEFWRGAGYFAGRGLGPHAAFLLHQSVERLFRGGLPGVHGLQAEVAQHRGAGERDCLFPPGARRSPAAVGAGGCCPVRAPEKSVHRGSECSADGERRGAAEVGRLAETAG
jgi:hypothetical protein